MLDGSVAADYSRKLYGDAVEVLESKDVATMFEVVKRRGRLDATVQDNPAQRLLHPNDAGTQAGRRGPPAEFLRHLPAEGRQGTARGNSTPRSRRAFTDGTLQRIYTKYGLWNADQEWLCYSHNGVFPTPLDDLQVEDKPGDKANPLAPPHPRTAPRRGDDGLPRGRVVPAGDAAGLLIGVGRVYGPVWLTVPARRLRRGDPRHAAAAAAVLPLLHAPEDRSRSSRSTRSTPASSGWRSTTRPTRRRTTGPGLLAIPKGQMEAALALGMTPFTAIRTVIVPQAVRIVIPPVTNDFIALFKDTSVCSVILITELTRKYNELYNFNRDLVVELAFITAGLYLLMSYPLSLLARWLEKRMGTHAAGGHR